MDTSKIITRITLLGSSKNEKLAFKSMKKGSILSAPINTILQIFFRAYKVFNKIKSSCH